MTDRNNRGEPRLEQLMQVIGYSFKDRQLLEEALTHSSYANEHQRDGVRCNERLEFLGDSVLSIVVSDRIFSGMKELPEGELTRMRASLVCESSLAGFANSISLGEYMRFGRGERSSGGAARPSILADCFEALIAAIYLDGGYSEARRFVLGFVEGAIAGARPEEDSKTLLQEIIQKNPGEKLRYVVVKEEGPDHCKVFTVEVHLNSNVIGVGTGSSKKHAEQSAAREALRLMGID